MSSSDSEVNLADSDEDEEIIDLTGEKFITSSSSNTAGSSMNYSQSAVVSSTSNFNNFRVGNPLGYFYTPTDPVPSTSSSFFNPSTSLPTIYGATVSTKTNVVDLAQEDGDTDSGESNDDAVRESTNIADEECSDDSDRLLEPSAKINSKAAGVLYRKRLEEKRRKKNLDGRAQKSKRGSVPTKKTKEKQGKESDSELE